MFDNDNYIHSLLDRGLSPVEAWHRCRERLVWHGAMPVLREIDDETTTDH